MRGLLLVISVLFSLLTVSAPAATELKPLSFKIKGEKEQIFGPEQWDSKGIKPRTISVFEPHEGKNVDYVGYSAKELLNLAYGNEWQKWEEVVFTCTDGYQPSIPVSVFNTYDAYFVYERTDSKEFSVVNTLQNNEKVTLGPWYLIWDNVKNPELKENGASGWPYQVEKVDLVQFADRYPQMAPPKNKSAMVQSGFMAFRKYCMSCHKINGEGGDKSRDLNYPMSVTEIYKAKALKQWLLDPQSVRPGTLMPKVAPDAKDRNQSIDAIIHYLEVMARNKKAPRN